MILNSPDNRKIIIEYLNSLTENEFINDVIIPLFGRFGYRVYRTVKHGPGEHGKDVIFVRYDPLHMAEEFIAVQAKAEKVSTANVRAFADQVDRAMKTGFQRRSGDGRVKPHFVFFMNSKTHTNDANEEFIDLVSDSTHTRILSQEHLCDMLMTSGLIPKALMKAIATTSPVVEQDINDHILKLLMSDDPKQVNHLLDHEVKLVADEVSPRMRKMIIDFAKKKWEEDSSFSGTVRPMRWYDQYADFFQPVQYPYFLKVLEEYTSDNYYSYEAAGNVSSLFKKLSSDHVAAFADEFVRLAVNVVVSKRRNWRDILELATATHIDKKITNPILTSLIEYAEERQKPKDVVDKAKVERLRKELTVYLYGSVGDDDFP